MWAAFLLADGLNRYTIGALIYDTEMKKFRYRLINDGELLRFYHDPREYLPSIRIVRDTLDHWTTQNEPLAYSEVKFEPWTTEFWTHVKKLLNHQVRLTDPLPIDVSVGDFDKHFDNLYRLLTEKNIVRSKYGQQDNC